MGFYLSSPPNGPLSRVVAAVFAVLALVGAFFFGMIVLALAAGLGLVAWLGLTLRILWLRRQWEHGAGGIRPPGPSRHDGQQTRGGDVIDADYEVISRRDGD